jgi:hypothetical protein
VTIKAKIAVALIAGGGAAGGDALYLNNGDLIGVRNIQGGSMADPAHGSLNLDIGAGSTANPGDIAMNWDVGRRVLIYDGHKHLVASFGPAGIRFYRRPVTPAGPLDWTSAVTRTTTTSRCRRTLRACQSSSLAVRRSPRRSLSARARTP